MSDGTREYAFKMATPMKQTSEKEIHQGTPTGDALTERLSTLENDLTRLKQQIRRSQRLAALGTTAAMLAHEFNNLMTPVMGYARHALRDEDPAAMAKALRTTLTQTETALAITERILGMAVDEPVAFKSVRVSEIVENAVGCLCRDLSKDGVTLVADIDPEIRVWADAKQLQQVFFNLILNARDALSGRTGRVTIGAQATDDDTVEIRVQDNGCGIAPQDLETVFDGFVSTKRSSGNGHGGAGLGLTVCRDIIEDHRGRITVQSDLGRGTCFTLTLPSAG